MDEEKGATCHDVADDAIVDVDLCADGPIRCYHVALTWRVDMLTVFAIRTLFLKFLDLLNSILRLVLLFRVSKYEF